MPIKYSVGYGYDDYGRFGSVTSSLASLEPLVVNYSYLPGSDLLAGYTQGNLTRAVAYEANRDLVDTVENKYGATTVSKFDYTNDGLGRRTNREDTGTAFAAAWTNNFGYNLRSEITGAGMRNGNSSYTYDPIGNRTTVTLPEEQNPLVYAANPLNQYTAITGRTAPAYDFDGNMTDDGAGLGLAWDGENRLIQTVKNGQTVTYAYDFMSRRVSKTVGGTTHGYLYDGWNLISETDGTTVKRYVWGLDLSQSLQGAGGVGGLLACSSGAQPPEVFAPTYDANGNISEYIALSTGVIASHLEYDAFGRTIASTGTAPSAFGFSTKYTDTETGLVYYGYRYYSAELERWLSRDSISERGGINLYFISGNNILDRIDILGQAWKISRKKEDNWAIAEPETVNDTFRALSIQIRLEYSERTKWIKGPSPAFEFAKEDSEAVVGCKYKIPNTVIVYTSFPSLFDWELVTFVSQCRDDAVARGRQYENNNYKVLKYLAYNSQDEFIDLWKTDGIYAFIAGGHGNKFGYVPTLEGDDAVNAGNVHPPYKLQSIVIFSCKSATQHIGDQLKADGEWVTHVWQDHLSSPGTFMGYTGMATYANQGLMTVVVGETTIPQ